MSQHDYNIANQGFPNFRSDLNNALGAIATNNSGSTAPTTTFAHQWWLDTSTTPNTLRIRNADNDAWVVVGTVNQTDDTFVFTPAAGSASAPAYSVTGDTNTGIFFPAADTIAFAEGGAEAMRIDSSGNVGIGTNSPTGAGKILHLNNSGTDGADVVDLRFTTGTTGATSGDGVRVRLSNAGDLDINNLEAKAVLISTQNTERMRIDSSGNVLVGTTSSISTLTVRPSEGGGIALQRPGGTNTHLLISTNAGGVSPNYTTTYDTTNCDMRFFTYAGGGTGGNIIFGTNTSNTFAERARITSGGDFCVGKTLNEYTVAGCVLQKEGTVYATRSGDVLGVFNRLTNDGDLIQFYQANALEGAISVSGNTVTYGSFSGGHWSQLQQGRGYNPDIPRGTVMSTIGEMCEWKSVVWDEVIEHPAVPAVEAKEAVLDEEGNVIEPAVDAVEGKDAWTETINKRESYLGSLTVGATFEENGVTKTVVNDGNERLPKVKISDVVGDKAVYGVFQTWDEVQDMLVTSLGAFVVRIAAGVTVQIGDLLESNGDGCAKVQDDDVIRSKTIGKVTSITPSATYADGSYTVPAVLYCG